MQLWKHSDTFLPNTPLRAVQNPALKVFLWFAFGLAHRTSELRVFFLIVSLKES